MASSINASTAGAGGVITTADNSGVLQVQTAGTTALTISASQVATFAGTVTATGGFINGANTAPAFSAYASANQSISSSTDTKLQFNTETFDTNNNFDSTTNYRFTPTVAGYYQINLSCRISCGANEVFVTLFKNGSAYLRGNNFNQSAGITSFQATLSVVVSMNGSTDYLEGYIYQSSGSSQNTQGGSQFNNFSGFLARSA